jgi:hypothetical protein
MRDTRRAGLHYDHSANGAGHPAQTGRPSGPLSEGGIFRHRIVRRTA